MSKDTNKPSAKPNLFEFCRAKVSKTLSKIRTSRAQNQIYLGYAPILQITFPLITIFQIE